jgi:hypothetical protein
VDYRRLRLDSSQPKHATLNKNAGVKKESEQAFFMNTTTGWQINLPTALVLPATSACALITSRSTIVILL